MLVGRPALAAGIVGAGPRQRRHSSRRKALTRRAHRDQVRLPFGSDLSHAAAPGSHPGRCCSPPPHQRNAVPPNQVKACPLSDVLAANVDVVPLIGRRKEAENGSETRRRVRLPNNDVTLRGLFVCPRRRGPHPAITMAHGFAGVKEHGLERFAKAVAAAGLSSWCTTTAASRHRRIAALRTSTPGADRRLAPRDKREKEKAKNKKKKKKKQHKQKKTKQKKGKNLVPGEPALRNPDRIGGGQHYAGAPIVRGPPTDGCARWSPRCPHSGYHRAGRFAPPTSARIGGAFADDDAGSSGCAPATQAVVIDDPSCRRLSRARRLSSSKPAGCRRGLGQRRRHTASTRAARMYEPTWVTRVSSDTLLMVWACATLVKHPHRPALGAYEESAASPRSSSTSTAVT